MVGFVISRLADFLNLLNSVATSSTSVGVLLVAPPRKNHSDGDMGQHIHAIYICL